MPIPTGDSEATGVAMAVGTEAMAVGTEAMVEAMVEATEATEATEDAKAAAGADKQ